MRASTLLGSWARIPDLIAEPEVVELLKRGRRSVVTGKPSEASDDDVELVEGPSTSSRPAGL